MTITSAQARAELEAQHRPVTDKLASAAEAVSLVTDGDHIAVGGTLYSRTPMALLFELLRAGRSRLTLSRPLACHETELFLAAGAAECVVASWVPTRTMLGSDLVARNSALRVSCPYTGEDLLAIPALVPDVAILHVHRADIYGNVQVDGYRHMDVDMARAARRVIVSAEEIVSPELIEAGPATTMLPHFAVDAVVEAPFGAYPHECYGLYEADFRHFDDYVAMLRQHGPDGARRYVDSNVRAHEHFAGFLDAVGGDRLRQLARSAQELTA
jgi:glutaconate CoA-transferase, subunit A